MLGIYIIKIIIMKAIISLIHITLNSNACIFVGVYIFELMDLIECGAYPCNIFFLEVEGGERADILSAQEWKETDMNGSMQDTNDGASSSVIMNRGIVSNGPDFHDIGNAWRFAIVLAKCNAQIGFLWIWLVLVKFGSFALESLVAPFSWGGDAVLYRLCKVRKVRSIQSKMLA